MPKNKIIIALGLLIALMPFLGFPRAWEEVLQVLAGLSIVLFTFLITFDKRLSQKAKARARQARKLLQEQKETSQGAVEGGFSSPVTASEAREDQNFLDPKPLS